MTLDEASDDKGDASTSQMDIGTRSMSCSEYFGKDPYLLFRSNLTVQ